MNKKLVRIWPVRQADWDPDLSYIGEYTNKPDKEHKRYKKRFPDDDYRNRRELQYFVSTNASNRMEAHQDYKRMEDYYSGEWGMVCVYVHAEIHMQEDGDSHAHIHRLRSPGVWSVETDSSPEDFAEVTENERDMLVADLEAFGFTQEEINNALADFDPAQYEEK